MIWVNAGISNTRPAGRMWPAKGVYAARGPLKKCKSGFVSVNFFLFALNYFNLVLLDFWDRLLIHLFTL